MTEYERYFDGARCNMCENSAMVYLGQLHDANLLFGCQNCGVMCLIYYTDLLTVLEGGV